MHRLRTLHLFAGAGGGILSDLLLGHQPVCAVEINEYCQQVLSARQKDGCLPWFPIFADVTQFDGRPWAGIVDVVSGGFPCQDISSAGKGAGITGERSGLWKEFSRIIGEVRPRYAFIENSPMLVTRGLNVVLCDLAAMGYDAEWGIVSAADCGAPHERKRIWIVAKQRDILPHTMHDRIGWRQQRQEGTEEANDGNAYSDRESVVPVYDETSRMQDVGNATSVRQQGQRQSVQQFSKAPHGNRKTNKPISIRINREWPPEPDVGRKIDGMA